jgi:hypothetical protein
MKRPVAEVAYPFLWAMVPVLFRAYQSPGYFTLADVATVTVGSIVLVGVVYLVAAAAFGDRAEGRLPALCAMLGVVWLFGFDPLAKSLPHLPHHLAFVLLGLLWAVLTVVLVRWLARRPAVLRTASVFLALAGALLVVRFAVSIVVHRRWSEREIAQSPLRHMLARPIQAPARAREPLRDIYVIVLDEYANADVLRTVFGFDNGPFLDSLRALGFHVPRWTGSNYAHTTLSLPSLLNAAHVAAAERELPTGSTDPTLMNRLVADNRVARFLKRRGYRYILFPSMWWGSTQASPIADSIVRVWANDGFALERELSRTELRRVLRRETILDYVHRDEPWDAEFVRRTLAGVALLPSLEAPVFAFVHVLNPHWPYVFDRECHIPRRVEGRDPRKAYIGQLECLNGLVLATVGRLIHDSKVAPVIILQGDHGSLMRGHWVKHAATARVEAVPASVAWERFGAFGAYYLPDSGAAAFGDSVTVVNVMGNVLRHYFGAELPREPDERYLSVEHAPFRFKRVETAWLDSGRSAPLSLQPDSRR